MQPIQELLNRIRWDAEFGAAEFRIGYYDRIEDRMVVVALASVEQTDDALRMLDAQERPISVPLHRVRQVFRNGELIWSRG